LSISTDLRDWSAELRDRSNDLSAAYDARQRRRGVRLGEYSGVEAKSTGQRARISASTPARP
jgi:hypothetical protein